MQSHVHFKYITKYNTNPLNCLNREHCTFALIKTNRVCVKWRLLKETTFESNRNEMLFVLHHNENADKSHTRECGNVSYRIPIFFSPFIVFIVIRTAHQIIFCTYIQTMIVPLVDIIDVYRFLHASLLCVTYETEQSLHMWCTDWFQFACIRNASKPL